MKFSNIVPCFILLVLSGCGGGGGGGGGSAPVAGPSSEASLSSLSIAGVTISPAFSSTATSYTATVPNGTDTVDISVATTDSNANFQVDGSSSTNIALPVGDTTIRVTVTAENGTTTREYAIVVTREAPPLASIEIESNTTLMVANGTSTPTLTISFFDTNGDAMNGAGIAIELQANDVPQPTNQFTTMLADDYALKVVSGAVESNVVTVTARESSVFPILTLPIVFHIVHFGEPIGIGENRPASDVDETLEFINEAFSSQTGSIDPNAVDTFVRFRLAAEAPDGTLLAEAGINRIDGTVYDDGSPFNNETPGDQLLDVNEAYNLQGQTYWNPREYINFWVITRRDNRGAALLPRMLSSNPLPGLEAFPMDFNPTPDIFAGLVLDGRRMIDGGPHEIAHVLGLLHPFSSGQCGPGDYLDDTYNYRLDLPARPACPGSLGIQESTTFMDYDGTFNTFTYDQRERLQTVLEFGIWVRELPSSTR